MGGSGTKLGCRGLPLDMTAADKTQRDAGSIRTERIGKVFAVRRHGLLECLVCGEVTMRAFDRHERGPLTFVASSGEKHGRHSARSKLDEKFVRAKPLRPWRRYGGDLRFARCIGRVGRNGC